MNIVPYKKAENRILQKASRFSLPKERIIDVSGRQRFRKTEDIDSRLVLTRVSPMFSLILD